MEKSTVGKATKRDEWKIKDDLRAVKRALAIFKDKERLADVVKMIKEKKEAEVSLDALVDGDVKLALGL